MLCTHWIKDNYANPDRNVYKVDRFVIPQPTERRSTRTFSYSSLPTWKRIDLKSEMNKLSQIAGNRFEHKEISKQLTRTRCEIRKIDRERDISTWRESNNNEKVRLSALVSCQTSRQCSPDQSVVKSRVVQNQFVYSQRGKPTQPKRKALELPKQPITKKFYVNHSFKIRMSKQVSIVDSHTEIDKQQPAIQQESQLELPKSNNTQNPKKNDDYQDMIELFSQKRFKAIQSDIGYYKKEKVNFAKVRTELKKMLLYIHRLKLGLMEVFQNKVLSEKPYEKPLSYQFIQAAKYGNVSQIKEYIQINKYLVYDFDYIYMTALHWACKRGHYEVAKMLIAKGSDIMFQDIIGRPALYFAVMGGNNKIVKLLLDEKANPWSNEAVNYNLVCQEYNTDAMALLARARKQYIMLRITPAGQREHIWKNLRKQ